MNDPPGNVVAVTSIEDLRVLTVRQPHAWAIAEGIKQVENRSWRFPLPMGTTIAVQAGAKPPDFDLWPETVERDIVPDVLECGAVIAFADVVDDHHAGECGGCSPWALPDARHWQLDNVVRLADPVPVRGQLWLFVPPPDVTARLLAALGR